MLPTALEIEKEVEDFSRALNLDNLPPDHLAGHCRPVSMQLAEYLWGKGIEAYPVYSDYFADAEHAKHFFVIVKSESGWLVVDLTIRQFLSGPVPEHLRYGFVGTVHELSSLIQQSYNNLQNLLENSGLQQKSSHDVALLIQQQYRADHADLDLEPFLTIRQQISTLINNAPETVFVFPEETDPFTKFWGTSPLVLDAPSHAVTDDTMLHGVGRETIRTENIRVNLTAA